MRQSKEQRIIDHGTEVLKELHKVYLEGIGIDEYYKLLSEYKKLFRRYEKTIKLSDNMGNEIMEQNDSLNDNLQYTIKTARNKLLENVKEHRKTKDVSSSYKDKIKEYEEALKEAYAQNAKIEKKLNSYIKHFGEINHTFTEDLNPNVDKATNKLEINPVEYRNMDIKKVVALELTKFTSSFILVKVKLNNFNNMKEVIEKSSSINNFINGTYKYLKNSFPRDYLVFHSQLEVFYIIVKEQEIEIVKEQLEKLNKKRKVLNFSINFSIGLTKYILEKDNTEIVLKRCEAAFKESEENGVIVVR